MQVCTWMFRFGVGEPKERQRAGKLGPFAWAGLDSWWGSHQRGAVEPTDEPGNAIN